MDKECNKTPPEKLEYIKKWQEENKDKRAEHMRTYYQKNKEHLKKRQRERTEKLNLEYEEKRFNQRLNEMDDDELISCFFRNLQIAGMDKRNIINEISKQDEEQIRETFMKFYRRFEKLEDRKEIAETLENRIL